MPVDVVVVITANPDECVPAIRLGELLKGHGIRCGFVCPLVYSERRIREAGFPVRNVHSTAVQPRPTLARLIANAYSVSEIRGFYLAERRFLGGSERTSYARALRYITVLEDAFEEWQPGCVLQNPGAELLRRAAYAVARRRGVRHMFARPTPFPGRVVFCIDSETEEWNGNPLGHGALSVQERAAARELAAHFRSSKIQLAATNRPAPDQEKLGALRRLMRLRHISREPDMGTWDPYWRLKEYGKAYAKSRLMMTMTERPDLSQPSVFFPIHAWHDSAITVRAPQFFQQDEVVEALADALPPGHRLLVKEHPTTVGRSPLGAVLRMKRTPRVVLLEPHISSHEVIEHCRAVVTISSKAGFEGLCHRKPVVVLGRPFYSGQGVTIDVEDLENVGGALAKAIGSTVDADAVDAVVWRAYNVTDVGSHITTGPVDLDGLARSFAKRLAREQLVG